ncbi:UNVERIFIED_ORG: hypothetical protein J3A77_000109 [Bacillus sp. PvP124]|nr:hypothetical protein [Bacillus sp. PvP124]
MLVIKSSDSVTAGMFTREPICAFGSWFVYKNIRGKCNFVEEGKRLSQIELKADNYTKRYTVVKDIFTYKHSREYHSMDPGRAFQINVQLNISVANPITVVQSNIWDIRDYMDSNIKLWIEAITLNYKIENFMELKQKIYNIGQNTHMVTELEKRGFVASQIQAEATLGTKDWEFYQEKEEIKRQAALERDRLAERKKIKEAEDAIRLEEEAAEQERRRIERENQQRENERLAQLGEEKGIDRIIIERSDENRENLDILIRREQENKEFEKKQELERIEHQRKMDEQRLEHERKLEEQRLEHERKIEEKRLEIMSKLMERQIEMGADNDAIIIMGDILNGNASSSSPHLVTTKSEKQISGWGGNSQVDTKKDTKEEEWEQ